jgi:hypothetical protein
VAVALSIIGSDLYTPFEGVVREFGGMMRKTSRLVEESTPASAIVGCIGDFFFQIDKNQNYIQTSLPPQL